MRDVSEPDLTAEAFASAGRLELADALRDLIHVAMTAEPRDDRALAAVTAAVRRITDDLAGDDSGGAEPRDRRRRRVEHNQRDYEQRSLLFDRTNPLAPAWQWAADGDAVVGHGSFGAPYEGAAGLVHGGWIALAFDELLGFLNNINGIKALTGTLTVRYVQPTRLGVPLEIVARPERFDGRRVINRATMTAGGVVTAEAEGIFIRLPEADASTEQS